MTDYVTAPAGEFPGLGMLKRHLADTEGFIAGGVFKNIFELRGDRLMPKMLWGRTEKVALTDDDFVEVRDAIGGVLSMPPNAARGLHRELGKFLSLENDGKPLAQPTRGDFRALLTRVEALEKQLSPAAGLDSGQTVADQTNT